MIIRNIGFKSNYISAWDFLNYVLGENPDLTQRKEIHAVASLLKLYLRELPEPLIPYDFFEVFLTAAKCKLRNIDANIN